MICRNHRILLFAALASCASIGAAQNSTASSSATGIQAVAEGAGGHDRSITQGKANESVPGEMGKHGGQGSVRRHEQRGASGAELQHGAQATQTQAENASSSFVRGSGSNSQIELQRYANIYDAINGLRSLQNSLWWLVLSFGLIAITVAGLTAWSLVRGGDRGKAESARKTGVLAEQKPKTGVPGEEKPAADEAKHLAESISRIERNLHELIERPFPTPDLSGPTQELASIRRIVEARIDGLYDLLPRQTQVHERSHERESQSEILAHLKPIALLPDDGSLGVDDRAWAGEATSAFNAIAAGSMSHTTFVERFKPKPVIATAGGPGGQAELVLQGEFSTDESFLSLIDFPSSTQICLLLPSLDAIGKWGMFLVNNGGVLARLYFGDFYSLEKGAQLSVQQPAVVLRKPSTSTFTLCERGQLIGLK